MAALTIKAVAEWGSAWAAVAAKNNGQKICFFYGSISYEFSINGYQRS
jgi:hypothetical protein